MCREEFRLRNFKLSGHPVLRDFSDSRFLRLPWFVAYRFFILASNLGFLMYNIYSFKALFFINVINLSYTVLNLYFAFALMLSCVTLYRDVTEQRVQPAGANHEPSVEVEMGSGDENENRAEVHEQDVMRLQHKVLWVLYVISANTALLVTIVYWTALYKGDFRGANHEVKHAGNSLYMLSDTFLSAMPVRLFHFVYPLIYMVVYLAFTVVYWALGGTNFEGEPFIYRELDYSNFQASTGALVALIVLLAPLLLQLGLFCLTKLRDYLFRRWLYG